MRRVLCLILMTLAVALLAVNAKAETKLWVAIGASAPANVRSSPTSETDKNIIGEVNRGDVFEFDIWKEKDRFGIWWVKIPYNNSINDGYGWVRWSFFSITEPGNEPGTICGNGRVRFREEPNMKGKFIKWLQPGTEVRILASLPDGNDIWYKVRVGKQVGWVLSDFVSKGELEIVNEPVIQFDDEIDVQAEENMI